jgi:hypothetical protein
MSVALKSLILNATTKHTATVIFLHVGVDQAVLNDVFADETALRVWATQAMGGTYPWRASLDVTLTYPMSSGSCPTRKP